MKGLKKGPGSTPFALGLRPRSQGVEPGGMTHFIEYSQTRRCQTYYTRFLRRLRRQPSSVYFYIKKTDVVGSFWAADGKSIDIMFYFEVVTVASWLQV